VPGDLRDPEQYQPWHYDPKYDATPNMFDPGAPDMAEYLQSVAQEATGSRLGPSTLTWLKEKLDDSGLFHLNPGDPSFRDAVKNFLMSKRIASHARFQ
jgi:hypothetical protein